MKSKHAHSKPTMIQIEKKFLTYHARGGFVQDYVLVKSVRTGVDGEHCIRNTSVILVL